MVTQVQKEDNAYEYLRDTFFQTDKWYEEQLKDSNIPVFRD